ncbi:hypothetical protein SAMN05421805_12777 [Saccharopolyspora antimicrobica]|uniref:Uncharacterized protein n=1 Tax=Saccharopolyspora antimicrobica TaxID=455193 RepID=A0A1I5KLS3_9PSEU|nr:hypothetical protein [Saccharopolyspora antimicrobica]RKT85620.1 hypothetical protein ATL45_3967 [Saccharopolyspora antimicrobica]SFO86050.1 hypothetical protein SAMN05421805_12777 [Saccharopolyspora antimicrobica]
MNDPRELLDNLERGLAQADDRVLDEFRDRHPDRVVAVDALRDVLGLTPPSMHADDDPELHVILTDGWTTCMDTVRRTIADKLGGAR